MLFTSLYVSPVIYIAAINRAANINMTKKASINVFVSVPFTLVFILYFEVYNKAAQIWKTVFFPRTLACIPFNGYN